MVAPHAADAQFWKFASSLDLDMSKWPPLKSMPALLSCSSMASGLNGKRLVSKAVYGNCAPSGMDVRHSAWPKSGGGWCIAGCPCSLPPPVVSVDCLLMLK